MKIFLTITSLAAAAFMSGCCNHPTQFLATDAPEPIPVTAVQSSGKIVLDGKIDEKAWQEAAVYDLIYYDASYEQPPRERARVLAQKFEGGKARILYDKDYVYVATEFEDKDVMGYAPNQQMRLHNQGDIVELFLGPVDAMHFWEIQVAPNGKTACFYYLTTDMPSVTELTLQTQLPAGLKSAVAINGKLNDQKSWDKSWTAEIRIPRKMFAEAGSLFEPGKQWTLRFGRWNASHNLYSVQKSYYPEQPYCRYFQRQYFAPLVIK